MCRALGFWSLELCCGVTGAEQHCAVSLRAHSLLGQGGPALPAPYRAVPAACFMPPSSKASFTLMFLHLLNFSFLQLDCSLGLISLRIWSDWPECQAGAGNECQWEPV